MTTTSQTTQPIQPGTVTYRRVAMAMGAWKWGYPRGERRNVTRYEARPDKAGVLRWYAVETRLAGGGITAHSEGYVVIAYPAAYDFAPGSIHRRIARIEDVGPREEIVSSAPAADYGQDEADGAACRAMATALAAARVEEPCPRHAPGVVSG